MSTSAALLLAQLALGAAPAEEAGPAPGRFELVLPAEVTLVGLTFGLRPELLFRPGEEGTRSRLRLAAGLFIGPEQTFVPVSFGYRAIFRQGAVVQPIAGAGIELQQRFVSDYPAVRQGAVYVEGGVGFELSARWSVGAMVSIDASLLGGAGASVDPRVHLSYRF